MVTRQEIYHSKKKEDKNSGKAILKRNIKENTFGLIMFVIILSAMIATTIYLN